MQKNGEVVNILLVEDDEDDFVLIRDYFSEVGRFRFKLDWTKSYQDATDLIKQGIHDVYLIDYRLDVKNGVDLIKESIGKGIKAPLILLTGQGEPDIDLMAMKVGAADYLVKDAIDAQILERSIRYAINRNETLITLNEKEQKYRTLFEQSIDAIFLLDRSFCFVDVNSSMQNLFNRKRDVFIGKPLKSFMVNIEDWHELREELTKEGVAKSKEYNFKDHKSTPLECQITISPLYDNDNSIYGYQGILQDISLRKKAEKELLLAEKMSMTGKIARTIAHEVRNPLTNLNLSLEQLNDEIPPENNEARLYADIIKRNANRIEQLISEMLNSSKPKQLQLKKVSLEEIVNKALALAQDRISLSGVKLEKTFEENVPQLMLDAELLRNAFLNIIINAIEAMESHKGHLKILIFKDEKCVYVSIRDNGSGISKKEQEKLFDPFYTDKKNGMGLGLTSVQNIIRSHNGSIEVESEINDGTTFIIGFPLFEK